MKARVVDWLKHEMTKVQDVRFASTRPNRGVIFQTHDADLTVQTWIGSRMHVYLVDQPVKLKFIRNKLKDNTRHGIGTLFIVDAALLPAHGHETALKDWQDALMNLNDGWIYAYYQAQENVAIIQTHFLALPRPDHYYCWHLTDFEIQSAIVRARTLYTSLKGEWKIGDITTAQYQRHINQDRVNQRYHYRTKTTQPLSKTPVDELYAYYELLGVSKSPTRNEVKSAYRKLAMKLHPDVSQHPAEEAEQRFKELNRAYEFVKNFHNWY